MRTSPQDQKILLVDDREENLFALEAILATLGHTLVKASSGAQALKYLLADDVSLILLDVQMPEMDGYETAAHIQSRPRTRDIPIIFLTAIDHEAHQAYRGYAAGAVDFLAKPFDPWELRAKVEVYLRLYRERRALEARVAELERAQDTGRAKQARSDVEAMTALLEEAEASLAPGVWDQLMEHLSSLRETIGPEF
ncbi:MAG TPA: response regulator [Acidimicrobiales bacterium]|nr:response regulator [Acidimicrobiales bacterium]